MKKEILIQALCFDQFLISIGKYLSKDEKEQKFIKGLNIDQNVINFLKKSGGLFGNPAMMIVELYLFIVLPKEYYKNIDNSILSQYNYIIEQYIYDKNVKDGNYFKHLRNSLSHGNYDYFEKSGNNFVKFEDRNPRDPKMIAIMIFECKKMGLLIQDLENKLQSFL